jgi:hypothetical protein
MSEIIKATLAEQRQILGTQLVKNHDFRDFTGKVFPETKGKWVFGSGYAGNAIDIKKDQSGNGNDLTASGGFDYTNQLTGTSPIYEGDNALVFDGLNDYWYIPAAQATDFNPGIEDFTIEIWFKTTYTAGYKGIIKKQTTTAGQGCYQLYIYTPGVVYGKINIVGGAVISCNSGNIADGNWTHVILVINQTTDIMYLYVNGIEIDNADISSIGTLTNSGNFNIGTNYNASGEYWDGEMSSLIYHAKVLTADEIKEQYELGVDWLWNRSGSIQKDNFKQLISGAGVVSQTVAGMTAGKTYKRAIIGSGATNEVINILNTNNEIELEDDTFSLASVRELEQDLAVKTSIAEDVITAAIVEDTLKINIEE